MLVDFDKEVHPGRQYDNINLSKDIPCNNTCKIHKEFTELIDSNVVAHYGEDISREEELSKICDKRLKHKLWVQKCLFKLQEYENINISTKELRKLNDRS